MPRQGKGKKQPRATAFTTEELIEIVRFLDAKNYEGAPAGEIKAHKTIIMQELSDHLLTKFGTEHSPRQLQKRFSDLKIREKGRIGVLRRKIARERGNLNERELAQLPREEQTNVGMEGTTEEPCNQTEKNNAEEDTIILNLENVSTNETPQAHTCCHDAIFWDKMEATINRCVEQQHQKLKAEIIHDMQALINTQHTEL